MAWVEVYGGQRSLAFELTTTILWLEIHNKHALSAMATMDDYTSSQVMWDSHITIVNDNNNNLYFKRVTPITMRYSP